MDMAPFSRGEEVICIEEANAALIKGNHYRIAYIGWDGSDWMVSVRTMHGIPIADCSIWGDWYARRFAPIDANITQPTTATSSAAINDHICKTCGNDRCSKTEKICWKCGGKL